MALALPAPASATFAGGNGRIVASYERTTTGDCGDSAPRWCETTTSRLVSMLPNGRDRLRLRAGETPAWSPDGSRLAYNRGETLWVSGGGGTRRIRGPYGRAPAWTPDGAHLVYGGNDGALYRVAPAGGKPIRLTVRASPNGHAGDTNPSVCRDGTIVFNRTHVRGSYIYLLRPGQRARRATRGLAGPPDCSPGGTRLLFSTARGTVIRSLRGNRSRLLLPTPTYWPRWSPDGREVVYSDGHDLFRVGLHGEPTRRLTRGDHAGDFRVAAWRPLS